MSGTLENWYMVRKIGTDVYHSGSYSHSAPKLYKKGHARAAMNNLNGMNWGTPNIQWELVKVEVVPGEVVE